MVGRWVLCYLIVVLHSASMIANAASVPAMFVLGDSTVDVGTNNHLLTNAKANFLYNGIDFPGGSNPTGRFSNGLNTADALAIEMGFAWSPPPFLDLVSQKGFTMKSLERGVNFASGASGLLNETGHRFGQVIPFGKQLQQFSTVRKILTGLKGQLETDNFLSKSVFIISVGSNDIFDYFASNGTSNKQEFITNLTSTYINHLRTLYSLGARRFGIISVPAIGCCPHIRAQNITVDGGCSDDLNVYSQMFYSAVEVSLQQISSEFQDMKYSLGNSYEMVTYIMSNPSQFGFTELKSACCGNGTYNGEFPCTKDATLCPTRGEYLFWDMFHPTETAATLAAQNLYNGTAFVTPINFEQLSS
ncbi:hypothetical protein ACHQM5_024467 [Ranunculus cassubicifolius]